MPSLEVSHHSTVTPDQIDDLGHMNVRYYGIKASAGTKTLCERLGIARPPMRSSYTRHHHEQMEGADLVVRSAVIPGGHGTPAPSSTGSSFFPPKAAGPSPTS